MKRTGRVFFVLFLLSAQFLFAQPAEKWSLEKCIDYALKNNLQVRQSAIASEISSRDHLQSKLNFLPTIDANANFNNNFGNGFNPQTFSFAQGNSQSLQLQLSGSIPLFTGLQQIHNAQRAKYDFMASKFDYEAAQNNIALSVASAFLQVLLNQEIEKVVIRQRDLSNAQRDIIKARIGTGALPETAIYDVESQFGRDEVNVINAKNAVDLSILSLKQLLQLKSETAFDIDAPELKADNIADISTLTSQNIYAYAELNQPVVKGANARVMSANASKKVSYGTLSPTLSAFGSLSSGYFSQDRTLVGYTYDTLTGVINFQGSEVPFRINNGFPSSGIYRTPTFNEELQNNFRKVVGLSMNIPLFSRGQKILSIQKARLQLQLRQLQLESSKNQLRQEIEQAFANAKAAAQSYLANKKSLEATQKSYQSIEARYKAGMSSNFDIQQAKDNLLAAESEMIKAKYTYVFRTKILEFYQGKAITLN